jgi:phenolic acid decarboxylase
VTFFPRWIVNDPKKIVCFQNEHLDLMHSYRQAGPTYPIEAVDEFSRITFVEDCGRDNEAVIACAPQDLPKGYTSRRN